MRRIVMILAVIALFAWGGVVEDKAETDARHFCETVVLGSAYSEVADIAKMAGEDHLRFIREDSIAVGFKGIPPFSRHACEVLFDSDKVSAKQYIHID